MSESDPRDPYGPSERRRTEYEERRDDRDRAFGDAVYEAWRAGLDSDAVTRDECYELADQGYDRFEVADIVVRRMYREREATEDRGSRCGPGCGYCGACS
jgi:hypothetical protein